MRGGRGRGMGAFVCVTAEWKSRTFGAGGEAPNSRTSTAVAGGCTSLQVSLHTQEHGAACKMTGPCIAFQEGAPQRCLPRRRRWGSLGRTARGASTTEQRGGYETCYYCYTRRPASEAMEYYRSEVRFAVQKPVSSSRKEQQRGRPTMLPARLQLPRPFHPASEMAPRISSRVFPSLILTVILRSPPSQIDLMVDVSLVLAVRLCWQSSKRPLLFFIRRSPASPIMRRQKQSSLDALVGCWSSS
jgi:hypothetical protein